MRSNEVAAEEGLDTAQLVVHTIGHSNHDLDTFLGLLALHRIEVLADVRSQPWSRYSEHFNRNQLAGALRSAGLQYVFLGGELGGRPEGDQYYDSEGHVLYDKTAEAPFFAAGLERLENGARRFRVAMMCSEGDPADCHRHLLVAKVLRERGVEVRHIRPDGSIVKDSSLDADSYEQGDLLSEGGFPWRSVRSVSQNTVPSRSSASFDSPTSID